VDSKAVRFVAGWVAALLSLAASAAGAADEFRTPSISAVRVDWRAALAQLRAEVAARPAIAPDLTFSGHRHLPASDPRAMPALLQLNAATSQIFSGIARSRVPVLLPFDAAAWLDAQRHDMTASIPSYQADFRAVDLFDAGPAGYDAVFALEPGAGDGMPQRTFAKPVEIQITGSLLLYDLADPAGGKGEPVKSLAAQYPDIRRFIREGYVRYAFTRFGVPYVASIQCLDSTPRPRRLACREAYPVAERFLKALHVAGGLPSQPRADISSESAERPLQWSAEFTYRPAGDIIAGSGSHKQAGHPDFTVYSQIRFPLEKIPAFIHSQAKRDRSGAFSGSYPWRDNFCEARSFNVGQCASGFGHQGEDIRPGACRAATESDHCDPRQQAVVAVRDGTLIRSLKDQAATLQINTRTEHVRFRYMHMNPAAMDADGILNGRLVTEGEKIGVVSNYLDHPNGTSRHLHFDVQVFTRDGWIWVSPYTTLISAYERLIGARGREIGPEMAATPAVATAAPEDVVRPEGHDGGGGN
jgi:hypothetical protein